MFNLNNFIVRVLYMIWRRSSGRMRFMVVRKKRLHQRGMQCCFALIFSLSIAQTSFSSPSFFPPTELPIQARSTTLIQRNNINGIFTGLPRNAELLSLRLAPKHIVLWGSGSKQRVLVLGIFSDRLERDVSEQSRMSIADHGVATVDDEGRVLAVAEGITRLTVRLKDKVVEVEVRVVDRKKVGSLAFETDVIGLLTKHGCNGSVCHGSVTGRAGFKLSLNGLQTREDYRWIVEGGGYQVLTDKPKGERKPRINLDHAEASLFLLKPSLGVSHGGGKRFSTDSEDYQVLLNWIQQGAAYECQECESVKLEKVEVFPSQVVLKPNARHQLLVTGYFSNGQRKDLTDQAYYISNRPEVIRANEGGQVEGVGLGETAVTIWLPGYTTSVQVGVIKKIITDYPEFPRRNLIDDHVFNKLKKFHILPSEISSDAEFLRRVCLDITGTLPPPQRVHEFLDSTLPDKRDRLIQTLLGSPEYIDYWTFRFADLFRVALYATGFTPKASHPYWEWIRESVANNKPYDQISRERIGAQGSTGPSRHFDIFSPPQDMMAEEVRVFLGQRLDCAQCHDHPFEMWTQNQYWGMAAFFERIAGVRAPVQGLNRSLPVLVDLPGGGWGVTGKGGLTIHPRTGKKILPTLLDGHTLSEDQLVDPRKVLARWVTSQPGFARAAVNRMWSYFFGRGVVNPVDDFRAANPPTHPKLLNELARDFEEHGFDLKHLIRRIVSSRTYQLSSTPNGTNKHDEMNYSRSFPRRLDAEVLLDAISQVVGVAELFKRSSGPGGMAPLGTRAIELKESDTYHSVFLNVYGRPDRIMVPERENKPNILQAMHSLAGSVYTNKISREGGRISFFLENKVSSKKIIKELSLVALSRFPTVEEQSRLMDLIQHRSSRREALEDLLWGLITSREFTYNH